MREGIEKQLKKYIEKISTCYSNVYIYNFTIHNC